MTILLRSCLLSDLQQRLCELTRIQEAESLVADARILLHRMTTMLCVNRVSYYG